MSLDIELKGRDRGVIDEILRRRRLDDWSWYELTKSSSCGTKLERLPTAFKGWNTTRLPKMSGNPWRAVHPAVSRFVMILLRPDVRELTYHRLLCWLQNPRHSRGRSPTGGAMQPLIIHFPTLDRPKLLSLSPMTAMYLLLLVGRRKPPSFLLNRLRSLPPRIASSQSAPSLMARIGAYLLCHIPSEPDRTSCLRSP